MQVNNLPSITPRYWTAILVASLCEKPVGAPEASRCSDCGLPLRRCLGSKGPQRRSGDEAPEVQGVVDGGMDAGQAEMPEGRAVRAKLVGRQGFRREAEFSQKLAHQSERRPLVAPTLDQHIEDL